MTKEVSTVRRDDILRLLQERPFRPFRLRLSNGLQHEIRHPEIAMVTPSSIVVGIPATSAPSPAVDDYMIVSLIHVVQIEHVGPAGPAPAN